MHYFFSNFNKKVLIIIFFNIILINIIKHALIFLFNHVINFIDCILKVKASKVKGYKYLG